VTTSRHPSGDKLTHSEPVSSFANPLSPPSAQWSSLGQIVVHQTSGLEQDAPDEPGVVHQISLPQPARLGAEPEQPLQSAPLHPEGRLFLQPRVEVESGSHADQHGSPDPTDMRRHPPFLLGSAETHP